MNLYRAIIEGSVGVQLSVLNQTIEGKYIEKVFMNGEYLNMEGNLFSGEEIIDKNVVDASVRNAISAVIKLEM